MIAAPATAPARSRVTLAPRPDTLQHRLDAIAALLTPCPVPDVAEGWDLCAHGQTWPCPATIAGWLARGLDVDHQTRAAHSTVATSSARLP